MSAPTRLPKRFRASIEAWGETALDLELNLIRAQHEVSQGRPNASQDLYGGYTVAIERPAQKNPGVAND